MAPPTPLSIATGSVTRLCKELASYHKEQSSQEAKIAKLSSSENLDENAEYSLKQEKRALEETKAIFPPLKQRIADACQTLEDRISEAEGDDSVSKEDLEKAKEALKKGKEV